MGLLWIPSSPVVGASGHDGTNKGPSQHCLKQVSNFIRSTRQIDAVYQDDQYTEKMAFNFTNYLQTKRTNSLIYVKFALRIRTSLPNKNLLHEQVS